jgi:hypothetical protein
MGIREGYVFLGGTVKEEVREYYQRIADMRGVSLSTVIAELVDRHKEQSDEMTSLAYKEIQSGKGSFTITVPKKMVTTLGWTDVTHVMLQAFQNEVILQPAGRKTKKP